MQVVRPLQLLGAIANDDDIDVNAPVVSVCGTNGDELVDDATVVRINAPSMASSWSSSPSSSNPTLLADKPPSPPGPVPAPRLLLLLVVVATGGSNRDGKAYGKRCALSRDTVTSVPPLF